jgi:hypothetical protein
MLSQLLVGNPYFIKFVLKIVAGFVPTICYGVEVVADIGGKLFE